jgi:hypothetical protein
LPPGDGILQNNKHGKDPDNTYAIIRINSDGSASAAALTNNNQFFQTGTIVKN